MFFFGFGLILKAVVQRDDFSELGLKLWDALDVPEHERNDIIGYICKLNKKKTKHIKEKKRAKSQVKELENENDQLREKYEEQIKDLKQSLNDLRMEKSLEAKIMKDQFKFKMQEEEENHNRKISELKRKLEVG